MTVQKRWGTAVMMLGLWCVDLAVFLLMLRRNFPVAIIALVPLGLLSGLTFVQFGKALKRQ